MNRKNKGMRKVLLIGFLSFFIFRGAKLAVAGTLGKNEELDIFARTIWGEARNQGVQGMQAVACVILNRSKQRLKTIKEVCLQPKQFSCWNDNDPNSSLCKMVSKTDTQFVQCLNIAEKATNGSLIDITYGANHYHTKQVNPYWADSSKITVIIGNHIFYKL